MKKIILIFIIALLSISAYSQDFETGNLKNKFYIRGGISTPLWTYYGYKDAAELKADLGAKSKIGGNFEVGSIFMINGLNIGNGLRFGINIDYLSLKAHVFNLEDNVNLYNFFVGSKIGPSFTYQPVKALAFDVFAKINPVWVGAIYENLQNVTNTDLLVNVGYVQLMYSFGINVRISVLMIGFEYEIGKLAMQNRSTDEYWPDHSDPNSKKTPMPGFNLTIGLNF